VVSSGVAGGGYGGRGCQLWQLVNTSSVCCFETCALGVVCQQVVG